MEATKERNLMKKRKDLSEYLPEKTDEQLVTVQAKIPEALRTQVNEALRKRNLTMKDLIVAAIKKFLDDTQAGS